MTESWYIVVDHTVCPYNKGGWCRPYGFGNPRECCRENCIMCIIEKKDLLKNGNGE